MTKRIIALLLALLALTALCSCAAPQVKDNYAHHCTLYIDCKTILDNMESLDPDKAELIPEDGVILESRISMSANSGRKYSLSAASSE